MRVMVFACLVAGACSFRPSPNAATDGNNSPGSDGSRPTSCFLTGTAFAFCAPTPTGPITLGTASGSPFFHTGNAGQHDGCAGGTYQMVGTTDACVLVGTTATIAANTAFVATEDYPLVIASTGDLDIAGLLDVSTQNGGQHGAGHNPSECATGIDGGSNQFGGGGGAGGTFGTPGANGGMGGNAAGASAAPAVAPTRLRGGCPSGAGGTGGLDPTNNNAPTPGGNPGFGGGAVLVVATGKVSVEGTINASGECGYGGVSQGGGGSGGSGGASGGMIVLAGASYAIPGVLVANGGGGGGGGDEVCCTVAGPGGLASTTMPQMAAAGGAQVAHGGHGGTGAATNGAMLGAAMAGAMSMNNGGGGGGGGGEGVIRYLPAASFPAANNKISPQAMPID